MQSAPMLEMVSTHVPVLAGEVIDLLAPSRGESVVDATFGGGGHAGLLADRIGANGHLTAIDRDPAAEERFAEFAGLCPAEATFIRSDFVEGLRGLAAKEFSADMVLLDLGVSSMQIDTRDRGFSYSCDVPLDMRMDPTTGLTAADLVNDWDERRLSNTFREFGEERHSVVIAREIVRTRTRSPITTTGELVSCIERAVPAPALFAGGHPAKRTFQALRIAVNDELGQLDQALPAAWEILAPGGRLAVISFHSLEDRRVKHFLAKRCKGCICPPDLPVCGCDRTPEGELITRRSVVPTAGEIAMNPRSRSARLRVVRKVEA
ncbi:MAG: 16S rRNA (cytosine(1402)-N(4))-methyltransferase RsmH [Solirubrobacterales bacterium]|nr:16S rRNA (cytosine(1402)-N(4))-methyltransferase RsmH [Solirubrobacterales bacterium]